ncbi:MAG: hypothetical protein MK096_15015 [Oleiphilaceae bacterium]|nr:hypothetical protein [Oleiphilaceae bacterium]
MNGVKTNLVQVYWGDKNWTYEVIRELGYWQNWFNNGGVPVFSDLRFYVLDDVSDVPLGAHVEYEIDGYDEARDPHTVFPKATPRGSCDAERYAEKVPEAKSKLLLDESWDGEPAFFKAPISHILPAILLPLMD